MGLKLAPKPEDIIHDATATPADVKSGAVFYNDNGRQIGTGGSDFIKSVIYTIPPNMNNSYKNTTAYVEYVGEYLPNNGGVQDPYCITGLSYPLPPEFHNIVGSKVDEVYEDQYSYLQNGKCVNLLKHDTSYNCRPIASSSAIYFQAGVLGGSDSEIKVEIFYI